MFEQKCNACQGTREFDFVTPEGELKHETCPYCASDYAYAALYPRMNPGEAIRLAIAVAIRTLERAPAIAERGAK